MSTKQDTKKSEVSSEGEVETPVLSVDESLTVEERLTDNTVENILPARYLKKDDNGNTVESPAELFERVADNVATAEYLYADGDEAQATFEEWRDEFEHQMETLQFIPNSPTLMNAGMPLQQLSACISGDTPIYTKEGLKSMATINEGDMVLTHTGSFKEVTSHWSNGDKKTRNVKRGTSRGNNYSVTATPDHDFLQEDGSWEELQNISDAKQPTASPDTEVPDSFDLTQYTTVMGKDKPVVSDGGVLKVENGEDPRTGTFDKQYSEIVASANNSDTFGYIAGAYLAEGDVDGSDLRFTIGSDEEDFEKRIVNGLTELFDTHVTVSESNHGNWKTISTASPFIADLFLTQFGTGSSGKRVPEWMFAADNSYQQAVLDGILDGDGHNTDNGWKLTLANPTLAYEASLLARNLGYPTNFTLEAENELSTNPTSRVRISKKDGRTYMNTISKTDGGKTEVFDMEVKDDHSFVAGDFVVHNCFVLEPGDSMTEPDENGRDSIMDNVTNAAAIFKSGGGVGYSFHHLRPKGTLVSSTKGTSSGPLSFMRLFDETCNTVKQGGKRRGAQMAIMRVDHPDIGRFVVSKRREGDFSNFNISAGLTDEFVEAVKESESYTLYAPSTDFEEAFETVEATRQFYSPEFADADEGVVEENLWRDYADGIEAWDWEADETVSFREKWADDERLDLSTDEEMSLPARFIWDLMIDGAWRNGEPGLFYLDETNREHTFDTEEHPEYEINATNPCAEQPLCNYEACNLGHINLSLMVQNNATTFDQWKDQQDHEYDTTKGAVVDYTNSVLDFDNLDRTIESGIRFLDNVVEMSDFPLDEIEETVSAMRKIGLGVMGWAQMLYQMGIPYGSEESYAAARHVMGYIDANATLQSHKLAKERGNFEAWEDSKYADPTEYTEWFEKHTQQSAEKWSDGFPMRNHNVTTVAPTGTTSMIADTSGGIEPVFSVAYRKNVGNDIQGSDMLIEFDSYFVKTLEANGYSVENIKENAAEAMRHNDYDGVGSLPISDELAEIFVTTNDLSSREHGLMQRAFQEAVDSGISKTINLPKEATHDDVHDAYMLSLSDDEVGAPIKGMTVYRDQSRQEQVKTTQEYSDKDIEEAKEILSQTGFSIVEKNNE